MNKLYLILILTATSFNQAIAFEWPSFCEKCKNDWTEQDSEEVLKMRDMIIDQQAENKKLIEANKKLIEENEKLINELKNAKEGENIFETIGQFALAVVTGAVGAALFL